MPWKKDRKYRHTYIQYASKVKCLTVDIVLQFLELFSEFLGKKSSLLEPLKCSFFDHFKPRHSYKGCSYKRKNDIRGESQIKSVTKSGKSPQCSWPPLPPDNLDFFEFGKNSKFDDPPPSDLIGKELKLGKFWILGPPLRKKITRRTTGAKGNKFLQVIASFR